MSNKGNQGSGSSHHLAWNDVDKFNIIDGTFDECVAEPHGNPLVGDSVVLLHFNGTVSDVIIFLIVCCHVDNFVGNFHFTVFLDHSIVWSLEETELINTGVQGQIGYKTNVRAFWRTDRVNTGVL